MRPVCQAALEIIKASESLRLKAYLCPAGKWTIGWGHTRGVCAGDKCTAEQAEAWLIADLADAQRAVDRFVMVPLTADRYGALVSLVFNIGSGHFHDSTLLRVLNLGKYDAAGECFAAWNRGGGKVLPGLVVRRRKEMELWNGGHDHG